MGIYIPTWVNHKIDWNDFKQVHGVLDNVSREFNYVESDIKKLKTEDGHLRALVYLNEDRIDAIFENIKNIQSNIEKSVLENLIKSVMLSEISELKNAQRSLETNLNTDFLNLKQEIENKQRDFESKHVIKFREIFKCLDNTRTGVNLPSLYHFLGTELSALLEWEPTVADQLGEVLESSEILQVGTLYQHVPATPTADGLHHHDKKTFVNQFQNFRDAHKQCYGDFYIINRFVRGHDNESIEIENGRTIDSISYIIQQFKRLTLAFINKYELQIKHVLVDGADSLLTQLKKVMLDNEAEVKKELNQQINTFATSMQETQSTISATFTAIREQKQFFEEELGKTIQTQTASIDKKITEFTTFYQEENEKVIEDLTFKKNEAISLLNEKAEEKAKEFATQVEEFETQSERFTTKAEEFEAKAEEARTNAERFTTKAEEFETKAEEARTNAEEFETKAKEFTTQVEEANNNAEEFATQVEEANNNAEEFATQVEEAKTNAEEFATQYAKALGTIATNAEEFETKSTNALGTIDEALKSIESKETQLKQNMQKMQTDISKMETTMANFFNVMYEMLTPSPVGNNEDFNDGESD